MDRKDKILLDSKILGIEHTAAYVSIHPIFHRSNIFIHTLLGGRIANVQDQGSFGPEITAEGNQSPPCPSCCDTPVHWNGAASELMYNVHTHLSVGKA